MFCHVLITSTDKDAYLLITPCEVQFLAMLYLAGALRLEGHSINTSEQSIIAATFVGNNWA